MSASLVDSDIEVLLQSSACCTLKYVVANIPFCVKDAEWAVRLACCGHVKLVCGQHQDIVNSVLPKVFVCTCCRAKQPLVQATWRI